MKKYYSIISAIFAVAAVNAQNVSKSDPALGCGDAVVVGEKVKSDVAANSGPVTGNQTGKVTNRGNVNYSAHIKIGATYYDLQTNAAMPHRLILHNDGAVSAAWTTSPNDQTNFPSRGTGFNFRNTSGAWGASDSSRVETSARTGWPNIGLLSNGKEFVIGHEANQGGFYISKAANRGDRPSGATLILLETPYKPIWARAANNGDTIHMINSYSDSSASGDVRAPLRNGVRAPLVYHRSLDGGSTWDIQKFVLPGYDSTLSVYGGGDQYAIDCRGNTVVIATGDHTMGVAVWKSTNFGTSWTRMLADSFPYMPYNAKKLMLDTPFTCDGSLDVLIDEAGTAHVFWGVTRVFDDDTTDESYSFFPGVQGIGYWNEGMNNSVFIAAGGSFDRDGDQINGLTRETSSALTTTGLPSGLNTVARLGNTSAMRSPNASIDSSGNMYCVFSLPIEGDVSDLNANFRDIGVVFSEDGGDNWGGIQNLTQVANREDDFGTVARKANGFLHMMWQQDEYPGTNLQNNSSSVGNHPVNLNRIMYQAIPVTDILNGNIGMQWGLKVEEPNTGEVMVVNQNYPNPFSGTTNVVIYMQKPGDLAVNVHSTTGALVKSFNLKNLYKGNHMLEIDATGLPAGIYTYSLTSGGSTVSRTMMVK
ncbi:MAG: T9SS type A sorting domain-containing protein [Bacteroidetes bacterium]|nr:T9SS type A sorting domain-containing protein [Bacteroidota bacterium]